MYINLLRYYAEYFLNNQDGFKILFSGVAINLLSNLYQKFLRDNEIVPVEDLPSERLEKYKSVALKYPHYKYDSDKITQSAYVLELITSTE
jgi:hypothetical protein